MQDQTQRQSDKELSRSDRKHQIRSGAEQAFKLEVDVRTLIFPIFRLFSDRF